MLRGEVVTAKIVKDIRGLAEKGDSENQKKMAKMMEKVIKSNNDGHKKV